MSSPDKLSMDFARLEQAAAELRSRVSGLVTDAFAAAPAAANAAASANRNYALSAALLKMFAEITTAIQRLTERTNEHAELLRSTAQAVATRDAETARKDFNAPTIFPHGR